MKMNMVKIVVLNSPDFRSSTKGFLTGTEVITYYYSVRSIYLVGRYVRSYTIIKILIYGNYRTYGVFSNGIFFTHIVHVSTNTLLKHICTNALLRYLLLTSVCLLRYLLLTSVRYAPSSIQCLY